MRCQPEVVELALGRPVDDSVHDERADASMLVARVDLAQGSYSIAALFSLRRGAWPLGASSRQHRRWCEQRPMRHRTFRSWIQAVTIMAAATDNHHTRAVEVKADQAGGLGHSSAATFRRKELPKSTARQHDRLTPASHRCTACPLSDNMSGKRQGPL